MACCLRRLELHRCDQRSELACTLADDCGQATGTEIVDSSITLGQRMWMVLQQPSREYHANHACDRPFSVI
eukprot:6338375-Amphidinium_carterae.2